MIYFQRKIRIRLGISVVAAGMILLVACSAASAGSYDDAVKASNPYVYYRFDDANANNGSTATDAMSNNNGTYTGTTMSLQTGVTLFGDSGNTAVQFGDTANHYVEAGTVGTFGSAIDAGGVTFECWMKTSEAGMFSLLGNANTGTSVQIKMNFNQTAGAVQQGCISVYGQTNGTDGVYRGGYEAGNSGITDGEWHYLAVIYKYDSVEANQVVDIYMADVGDTTVTKLATIDPREWSVDPFLDFTQNMAVGGARSGGTVYNQWGGLVDELALYKTALSESDMDAHLLAATVPEPATMALLLFGVPFALRRRRK